MIRIVVLLQVPYVVDVNTNNPALARQAVECNWGTFYKHVARPQEFPPHLSAKVIGTSVANESPQEPAS